MAGTATALAAIMTATGEATLTLDTETEGNARHLLRVQLGDLKEGARILVHSSSGDLVGSIFPFGPSKQGGGVFYTLSLPKTLAINHRIKIRLTVLDDEHAKPRAPTKTEVLKIDTFVAP